VITASTTRSFLSRESGLAINEVLCKARNLTIARGHPAVAIEQSRNLFEQGSTPRFKPSTPRQQELLASGAEAVPLNAERKK